VIERPVEGRRIETAKERGWKWDELVKSMRGRAVRLRAHVDALRLMAMFLNHWDNKDKNQRLLCLGEKDPPGRVLDPRPCGQPLAMVQDLGGTFGPLKLDLANWASTPIWADSPSCTVSMRALPYEGSTFPNWQISEEGRQFLAGRLGRLSARQVRELFEGARLRGIPTKIQQRKTSTTGFALSRTRCGRSPSARRVQRNDGFTSFLKRAGRLYTGGHDRR